MIDSFACVIANSKLLQPTFKNQRRPTWKMREIYKKLVDDLYMVGSTFIQHVMSTGQRVHSYRMYVASCTAVGCCSCGTRSQYPRHADIWHYKLKWTRCINRVIMGERAALGKEREQPLQWSSKYRDVHKSVYTLMNEHDYFVLPSTVHFRTGECHSFTQ